VRVKTVPNPIGSLGTALTVNGVTEQWLLDTGANQSVVSRSFARRLGLTPLPGAASTGSGFTGIKNPLQVAVLPTLQIGGATVRNVVLLILDDANLRIAAGKRAYQINAILGYPVFQALGMVTFRRAGEFLAGDAAASATTGTRIYMRGLAPAIECDVQGQRLPFTFDTGASGTNFSVRYYEQFQRDSQSWSRRTAVVAGAGGSVRSDTYRQSRVLLKVGDTDVVLRDVSIFPRKMNAGIDQLFGNLGMDVVAAFESFTLDFSNMTFSLGAPASRPRK
jgi:predicted aspartyl protease